MLVDLWNLRGFVQSQQIKNKGFASCSVFAMKLNDKENLQGQ